MLTAVRAGAYLHHLSLYSPDPERLALFYGDVMDMTVERLDGSSWMVTGPRRSLLFSHGPAKKLRYAAFGCREQSGVDDIRARAERERTETVLFDTPLLSPGAFSVTDPDTNTIVFGVAAPSAKAQTVQHVMKGPLQHLTFASLNVDAIERFYARALGFAVSDRVRDASGDNMTTFMRSNHEHHTIACFRHTVQGLDHHSYEAGEWNAIRDWCDRFADRRIKLMWGPGRHGPGNNLFAFIVDPDGNWIEISAELEVIHDRPTREWPHEERSLNLWGHGIMRI